MSKICSRFISNVRHFSSVRASKAQAVLEFSGAIFMMEIEVRRTIATLPPSLIRMFVGSLPRSVVTANPTERLTVQEADLIRRILAGEKELYYELICPYERSVYVAAFSILRSEADAEDCAQDAIL